VTPSQKSLTLPATPRAVRLAREWVAKVLAELGRPELVDSAELGVSELVTNAMLHSTPPVAVRVRGTREHPRIEVADRSLVPPRLIALSDDEEDLLSTFGRGLSLVALHSAAWGSDLDPDGHGKTVWFEPVAEPREDVTVDGDLFDIDETMALRHFAEDPEETIEIELRGMPVAAFRDLRRHYLELRRELRLLALTDPGRYPFAAELSDVALQVEQERRQSQGVERLTLAEADNEVWVDLVYVIPATAPATMGRLTDLMKRSQEFFESESLTYLSPTPRQQEVQEWYLGEFVRQGAGEKPIPWSGGYADHPRQSAS
jgi:anti-sigma regulatory factor (Ser/Thr protein kinase)